MIECMYVCMNVCMYDLAAALSGKAKQFDVRLSMLGCPCSAHVGLFMFACACSAIHDIMMLSCWAMGCPSVLSIFLIFSYYHTDIYIYIDILYDILIYCLSV